MGYEIGIPTREKIGKEVISLLRDQNANTVNWNNILEIQPTYLHGKTSHMVRTLHIYPPFDEVNIRADSLVFAQKSISCDVLK